MHMNGGGGGARGATTPRNRSPHPQMLNLAPGMDPESGDPEDPATPLPLSGGTDGRTGRGSEGGAVLAVDN